MSCITSAMVSPRAIYHLSICPFSNSKRTGNMTHPVSLHQYHFFLEACGVSPRADIATNLPPPLVYRNHDTSQFKKIQRSLVQMSITYGTEVPHFLHWNVASPETLPNNLTLIVLPGADGDISFTFQKPFIGDARRNLGLMNGEKRGPAPPGIYRY